MLNHCDISDDSHPEKPSRISGILKKYQEYNILDRCYVQQVCRHYGKFVNTSTFSCELSPELSLTAGCVVKGRCATMEELLLAHTKDYIDTIKDTEHWKPKELQKLAASFNSVYIHPETWASACVSTGSLLQVVDSVLNGESQSGVAIVRPPGHHAEEDTACGFCIFNNIAVAARYAIEFYHVKK